MLNNFFVNTHRTGVATTVKPLRPTTAEERQIDRENLKTWERVIEDVIRHSSQILHGMTRQDVTTRLLRLEPTSEDDAIDRLGGPTATVSALYLYLNVPNCTSGCIMLALQLEFTRFLTKLTRHMAIDTSEEPAQTEVSDSYQISNVLGYSLTSAVAELCCARSQYSPPVIILDTAQTIMELVQTEISGRHDNIQFLVGVIGITASESYFEGTFALCYPSSLLEESRTDSNAEPFSKRTVLRVPTSDNLLPRRV